ncbi:MAG: bifunctional phosphopantothenoylcysteine decarboxylase/phosphopantothenate--cysteine ligase CoaBC [Ignavibacteriae bacterium]|nr:MAG: bifunctional phosphopantothenoylcysteine decarboxylase/phosphopantothenate--cysteine ligase CoaBC [Ignavibacteriota bacterium]
MSLDGKKILLGISGGIAAYKTCELVRLFKKNGAEVRVVMTPSAVNFVTPLTLSTLSGNEVLINIFPEYNPNTVEKVEVKTWHIYTGMWADVFIIAPATANTIAKIVTGITDNFLTATVLASRCPVVVVPSMDEDMYMNEVTTNNIKKLKEYGYFIMEPDSGELASGLYGVGRMPEPAAIFNYTQEFLNRNYKDLEGKKVLVTAGPTYEPIDRVRFIGNYSSGKMGFQLARAASQRGAEVTLITGPTMLDTPRKVNRININTAEEMFNAVKDNYEKNNYIIMSAAVADYKPKNVQKGKIKKEAQDELTVETERTHDILDYLGKNKNSCKLIGFALETDNELENAKSKLEKKNLDMIVLNNPDIEGAGFGTDTNVASIINKNLEQFDTDKITKFELANIILDKMLLL